MKHTLLPNQSIRTHAKKCGVRIYDIADSFGVSQATITRRLRYELDETEQRQYIKAIDKIAASRATV